MDNKGQAKVKMSGCLYKKIKKHMISTWKMYWFVLEDRLLLYYRSKDEYQAISPCKGSINLGPPCIVKSVPSVSNAFQIQTRTNTFTLKAVTTEDQMKWMQALMSALNQNQNFISNSPKRLSHFRYSLDDLIPEREPNDCSVGAHNTLERQNTMPAKVETITKSSEIIQRLQKIGAHSYGGSLGAISKMSTKKRSNPAVYKESGSQNSLQETSRTSVEGHIEPMLRPGRQLSDNIYERISGDSNSSQCSNKNSFIVDNENYSVPMRKSNGKPNLVDARITKTSFVENDHYEAIGIKKTKSLLVENDHYEATEKKKSKSLLVENDHYEDIENKKSKSLLVENNHYEAIENKKIKSLLVENDQYGVTQNEEVIYAEPKINEVTDHNKNSVLVENSYYITNRGARNNRSCGISENVYEDLEAYSHYSQPILKNDETSSQSSQDNKIRPKLMKSLSADEKDKVKKPKSFIKRVWKKKGKKVEKQEAVDYDEIYEEVDGTVVEKLEQSDGKAMQMLSELQNILEHKKNLLKTASLTRPTRGEHSDEKPTDASSSNSDHPSLPPKTQKPQHHQPVELEKVRSLDEILEDLDKEQLQSNNKVKRLIERFSEPESDDVILRKHDKPPVKTERHSDELNKLLSELAKVTSAPIMTPGVTSSLVNPNLGDEEWLKLLPVRQRRMSEPDYDVPRPHRSVQLPVKHENSDAIPVTRFFGPVLPSTTTDNSRNKEDSLSVSMTPDSLEVEDQQKSQIHCSYTSHNYYKNDNEPVKNLKCFSHSYRKEDDKIIYAMPKSYLSVATHIVNTCQNICSAQLAEDCIIYKNVKNVDIPEEIFSDSLELCNESSTEF